MLKLDLIHVMILRNDELDRTLPKRKKKKVIGLMKDKLGGKIMAKFDGLKAKTYSYLIDEGSEDKKGKQHSKENLNLKIIKTV